MFISFSYCCFSGPLGNACVTTSG